ncbi:hypothetical protein LTR22_026969 [Elasticomyces elasticus]|nr:hypothetical protein LTR22_026969 [Elasticomyces elasticus]
MDGLQLNQMTADIYEDRKLSRIISSRLEIEPENLDPTYRMSGYSVGPTNEKAPLVRLSLTVLPRSLAPRLTDAASSLMNGPAAWRSSGRAALQAAAEGGHLEVVERLLDQKDVLALTLRDQHKYEEAESLYRQILDSDQQVLDMKHPDMLTYLSNFALVLRNQQKYEEAETTYRRVLRDREVVLGSTHPDILANMNGLADLISEMDDTPRKPVVQAAEKVTPVEQPGLAWKNTTTASGTRIVHGAPTPQNTPQNLLPISSKRVPIAEQYGNAQQEPAWFGQYIELVKYLIEKNTAVAKYLIEKNAEVNTQGGYYGNALQAACAGGHLGLAKYLIEKNAEVNVQGGYYGSALQAACAGGDLGLAKYLIEKSAEINTQGGYYGSALQAACSRGHLKLAKDLIEKNAEVNLPGGYYGSVLQAACVGGHLELAKYLVDNSAGVNAQGGYYGSALQAACVGGHLKLAKYLIEKNAEINVQGGYYGNALQAACVGGHLKLAKYLIEKNAEINVQGGYYGNALQAACVGGHLKLAKYLIEKNAEINVQGGYQPRHFDAQDVFDKGGACLNKSRPPNA